MAILTPSNGPLQACPPPYPARARISLRNFPRVETNVCRAHTLVAHVFVVDRCSGGSGRRGLLAPWNISNACHGNMRTISSAILTDYNWYKCLIVLITPKRFCNYIKKRKIFINYAFQILSWSIRNYYYYYYFYRLNERSFENKKKRRKKRWFVEAWRGPR